MSGQDFNNPFDQNQNVFEPFDSDAFNSVEGSAETFVRGDIIFNSDTSNFRPERRTAREKVRAYDVFDNSGECDLRVPGFGLPIDYVLEDNSRFSHGANDFKGERRTAREISMLGLMNALTDKADWHKKVFKDEIVNKWRQEAMSKSESLISEKAFDWCMEELRDKAMFFKKNGYIRTLDVESSCVKSDTLVSAELQNELKQVVEPLLRLPKKDWHPNSNDQVLNLVHPSLFPLVYGRTRVLTRGQVDLKDCLASCGKGELAAANQTLSLITESDSWEPEPDHEKLWSRRFQWLPCDVKFSGEKGSTNVSITSYINNLKPTDHQDLYRVIEKFISLSIKPWNDILIRDGMGRVPPRILTYGAEIDPPTVPDWSEQNAQDDPEAVALAREYLSQPNRPGHTSPPHAPYPAGPIPTDWETDTENWPLWAVAQWKWHHTRTILHPEPGISYTYNDWKAGQTTNAIIPPTDDSLPPANPAYTIDLATEFFNSGLQIIAKLSSIELSPSNPSYEGGSWHIEGMSNEHIVATAIYYYSVSNVTSSSISFRQESLLSSTDTAYEQDDHEPLCVVYGTSSLRDESAVQTLGSIATTEGRMICFPNTLQHRVSPFALSDPSQCGHRRVLVLWLVDPHYRVLSSANVPPQQHSWWAERVRSQPHSVLGALPVELGRMVTDEARDWPMGMDEAKELRLQLMQERTAFVDEVEEGRERYDFCEH